MKRLCKNKEYIDERYENEDLKLNNDAIDIIKYLMEDAIEDEADGDVDEVFNYISQFTGDLPGDIFYGHEKEIKQIIKKELQNIKDIVKNKNTQHNCQNVTEDVSSTLKSKFDEAIDSYKTHKERFEMYGDENWIIYDVFKDYISLPFNITEYDEDQVIDVIEQIINSSNEYKKLFY